MDDQSRLDTLRSARDWYGRWFAADALPLWASIGFDPGTRGFHERISDVGPDIATPRRARVQARQIWVYSVAAKLGVGEPRLDLACTAYDSFVARYRRQDGLFVTSLTPDGGPADATGRLYEQAFALLAMAGLQAAVLDERIVNDARALRSAIETFRHSGRGFREDGDYPFQSNAHMHLLEAAIAWDELGEPGWCDLAEEIVALALSRFLGAGGTFLREFFDSNWGAERGDDGRRVEPGHQFEWAWLLDRWAKLRGDSGVGLVARRLFGAGLAGVDRSRNAAVNVLWDDLSVRDAGARLWPQTEYLKASLALGFDEEALAAARGLKRYLDAPVRGAWRDLQRSDGAFLVEPAPASSLYHIAGACFQLLKPEVPTP
jgi:mannose-1-phosphate guanylyltransferase/mannose-6-phosphate isomerase